MPTIRVGGALMLTGGNYKPGDMPPDGYIERQDWYAVQKKAKLKQVECAQCGRWCFPQQLSDQVIKWTATRTQRGRRPQTVEMEGKVCLECSKKKPAEAP